MKVTTRLLALVVIFMAIATYYFTVMHPGQVVWAVPKYQTSFLNSKSNKGDSNARKAQLQLMQNHKDCFICD